MKSLILVLALLVIGSSLASAQKLIKSDSVKVGVTYTTALEPVSGKYKPYHLSVYNVDDTSNVWILVDSNTGGPFRVLPKERREIDVYGKAFQFKFAAPRVDSTGVMYEFTYPR